MLFLIDIGRFDTLSLSLLFDLWIEQKDLKKSFPFVRFFVDLYVIPYYFPPYSFILRVLLIPIIAYKFIN